MQSKDNSIFICETQQNENMLVVGVDGNEIYSFQLDYDGNAVPESDVTLRWAESPEEARQNWINAFYAAERMGFSADAARVVVFYLVDEVGYRNVFGGRNGRS